MHGDLAEMRPAFAAEWGECRSAEKLAVASSQFAPWQATRHACTRRTPYSAGVLPDQGRPECVPGAPPMTDSPSRGLPIKLQWRPFQQGDSQRLLRAITLPRPGQSMLTCHRLSASQRGADAARIGILPHVNRRRECQVGTTVSVRPNTLSTAVDLEHSGMLEVA